MSLPTIVSHLRFRSAKPYLRGAVRMQVIAPAQGRCARRQPAVRMLQRRGGFEVAYSVANLAELLVHQGLVGIHPSGTEGQGWQDIYVNGKK